MHQPFGLSYLVRAGTGHIGSVLCCGRQLIPGRSVSIQSAVSIQGAAWVGGKRFIP